MARKNIVSNYPMFGTAGGSMSGTISVTSNVSQVQSMDNIGIVLNWSGTSPVGTIVIQASNDQTTWVSLDFGSTISISGNTGSDLLNINQFPCSYIRAVYTNTSGTGTIWASLTAKQLGG